MANEDKKQQLGVEKVKLEFNRLLKNRKLKTEIKASLIIILTAWIFLALFYIHIPPQIPIFFSKPWGEDRLAEKWFLLILLGTLTIAFIINTRLASMTLEKDKLSASILTVAQLFFSILVLMIILRLILLVA